MQSVYDSITSPGKKVEIGLYRTLTKSFMKGCYYYLLRWIGIIHIIYKILMFENYSHQVRQWENIYFFIKGESRGLKLLHSAIQQTRKVQNRHNDE